MEKPRENPICPYCLSPIQDQEEYILCPVCGVAHHTECWRTNGKCSVYGCDGWQEWSADVANNIAPKLTGDLDLDDVGVELKQKANDGQVCIECEKPVRRGHLTCFRCRAKHFRFYDSCFGTGVIVLGGVVTVITLLLKGLS